VKPLAECSRVDDDLLPLTVNERYGFYTTTSFVFTHVTGKEIKIMTAYRVAGMGIHEMHTECW
jgi:hypothetical protein